MVHIKPFVAIFLFLVFVFLFRLSSQGFPGNQRLNRVTLINARDMFIILKRQNKETGNLNADNLALRNS